MTKVAIALSLAAALTACIDDETDDPALASEEQAGMSLNGMSLNGVSLAGGSLQAVSLDGVTFGGSPLAGVTLDGNQLVAVGADGRRRTGTAMVGAKLAGRTSTTATTVLVITAAQQISTGVWAYGVTAGGAPLCGNPATLAIPVAGTWDYRVGVTGGGSWLDTPRSFTFACRGQGAIAKCVELGYKPWTALGGVALKAHHAACVRMIRGDYCGDGRAWTQDGNKINAYDALGIQRDAAAWLIDAEWTPAGASCIRKTRAFLLLPSCFLKVATLQCGGFSRGTLLVNEVPLLDL